MQSRRFRSQPQLQQAASNSPSLKRGAKGPGVAEVQNVLRDLGFALPATFASRQADGIYGAETDSVVRQFQRRHGLEADGVVGHQTITKLDQILVEKPFLDLGDQAEYAAQIASDAGKPLDKRRSYHI